MDLACAPVRANGGGEGAGLERLQADVRVEPGFLDGVGVASGDFLDLDAAFGAGHHYGRALGAIEDDAQVELAGDVDGAGEEDFANGDAFRAGLFGDHRVGKHAGGVLGGLLGGVDELDVAGLAAAAGVDLGLDYDCVGGEGAKGLSSLSGIVDDLAGRDRNAGFLKQISGLIFVNFHADRSRKHCVVAVIAAAAVQCTPAGISRQPGRPLGWAAAVGNNAKLSRGPKWYRPPIPAQAEQ